MINWVAKGRRTLFHLFTHAFNQPYSLPFRAIQIGGVENYGNSCVFSVLLQELAALPSYSDRFLNTQLVKKETEDPHRFSLRQQLQVRLKESVEKIRKGIDVTKEEVIQIASLFHTLGWKGTVPSLWRRLLYRLAPNLFPLPHFSPYELYEKVIELLVQAPLPIVLLGDRTKAVQQKGAALWRICTASSDSLGPHFRLKLLHVLENGSHLALYLKRPKGWISCSDQKIRFVKRILSGTIYMAIYESLPLSN